MMFSQFPTTQDLYAIQSLHFIIPYPLPSVSKLQPLFTFRFIVTQNNIEAHNTGIFNKDM